MALGAAVVWAFVLTPDVSRRFSNPIVERSSVIVDVLTMIVIMGFGLAIPIAGLLLSRRTSRPGVGCGCAAAAFSTLVSLSGLLLILGLSGISAH